ncbi:MAG: flagellar basal-body MS-ring/collar protein FliF [Thermodesulfobacteriota bacterium]
MASRAAEQLSQVVNALSKGKILPILFILLLAVVGFGSLIFWNSQPDYQVLFSNLSPDDAGEMTSKLKEKKIRFQLTQGGTTLLVPRDQVYDLRLSLAAEGLPKGGGVGFEVFDRTNLGITDFVQKLNYQRALQGELGRTIKQIKEIEHVRVHIVAPKESVFIEEQKKPTASVFLKTRSGTTLSPSQVEGIVHLVASAVEGLEPGNITVIDTWGKILSKRNDTTPVGQLSTAQLEYQRNLEENLKKKVQGMLEEVLGPSKAIARVSAEIDFQQIDITEERYDPTTILRSEQRNTERSSSRSGAERKAESLAEGKTAGPKTAPASSFPVSTNSSERNHEIRNYEISRINKHIKTPVGQVKRLSAAVIVDGNYKEGTDAKGNREKQYVPRSAEELKSLENIVKKAIGYSEERGDQVEVTTMPFYGSIAEEEPKPEKEGFRWQEYMMIGYKPVVSLILAFLFIFFVIRPLVKKKVLGPEGEASLLESGPSPAISSGGLREIPQGTGAPTSLALKDQTVKLVQKDPTKTVEIMRTWLNEKE